ncbi:MAG: TonB-dependent receptor [Cyclobacteriaceae bacterium]
MFTRFFSVLMIGFLSITHLDAQTSVTLSGVVKSSGYEALPFVNVVLKSKDSTFVSGTITNENGLFTINNIAPADYVLEVSFIGYKRFRTPLFVGSNSSFLDFGVLRLEDDVKQLDEIVIEGKQDAVNTTMDKKTYTLDDNTTQLGGSVLQSMQNLPGVTIQDGQVQLRGNNRVMILIDGKQTAVTGFGNQNAMENIPASAVEKIEIINNPSARYDANGNAGIINIIMKKETDEGVNGTAGFSTGWGALWVRKQNLPGIRPQYDMTPKINPSISLNYRRKKTNLFLQADNLYTETLNKNEFVTRTYSDGTVINQQLKRNRDTNFFTSKGGFDWFANDKNSLTVFGFFSKESIKDRGDQPFFNEDLSIRNRLWQFLEDEVLTAIMSSAAFHHKFTQPGHELTVGFNYTFDREDEKYFFVNTLPTYTSNESFALIADQKVVDVNVDYVRPLKHGVFETGLKFRRRTIPTNMQFFPGFNSPLDPGAAGMATYKEAIPAVYGNYRYEVKKFEAEVGLRVEYVHLQYDVDPNHNTYSSDGYDYFQPFPNFRLTFSLDDQNKLSAFFNRRVDRPDEVDIRIFPKYDDAEIIKVGNPGLSPQFTNTIELGYKHERDHGYYYGAVYHKMSDGTITRIATTDGTSNLIYNVSQNAGKSYNTGVEVVLAGQLSNRVSVNLNLNGYYNQIDRFTVLNQYPTSTLFTAEKQDIFSGSVKLNAKFDFTNKFSMQLTTIYLAPDIIPQGKIKERFSVDAGARQSIQKGRGELFANASDLFNTMIIRKSIEGASFSYTSSDYYETQVVRLGYQYKF